MSRAYWGRGGVAAGLSSKGQLKGHFLHTPLKHKSTNSRKSTQHKQVLFNFAFDPLPPSIKSRNTQWHLCVCVCQPFRNPPVVLNIMMLVGHFSSICCQYFPFSSNSEHLDTPICTDHLTLLSLLSFKFHPAVDLGRKVANF